MRFEDLNWMDVESYLRQDDRIILITGATEQHGYLSLLSDISTPTKLALAAAEREKVLIAPPLNFGVSSMFVTFPGTISLSHDVYNLILTEIIQGLLAHGFAGFFILNGHGGNRLPPQVEDIRMDGQARILWHDWWKSPVLKAFEVEHGLRLDHANWGDNFRFNRVGPVPEGVKPPVNLGYLEAGQSARELLGDGSYGGPYQIDDALMDHLFGQLVDEIASLLRTLKNH
ncbi:MAG: creatininase family protein [Anaerolineae bacterium]|nr:creatininase family protein [Anaerolineae bacterium]